MRIYDSYNKQWLEPMAIFFGKENYIWRVEACIPGTDPLTDGFYIFEGDNLKYIAITGNIKFNIELLPN